MNNHKRLFLTRIIAVSTLATIPIFASNIAVADGGIQTTTKPKTKKNPTPAQVKAEKARKRRCKANAGKLGKCENLVSKMVADRSKLRKQRANIRLDIRSADRAWNSDLRDVKLSERAIKKIKSKLKTAKSGDIDLLSDDLKDAKDNLKHWQKAAGKSARRSEKFNKNMEAVKSKERKLDARIKSKRKEINKLKAAMRKDKC